MLRAFKALLAQSAGAVYRARWGVATIAAVYLCAAVIGGLMAHEGNRFALEHANRLVTEAHSSSPILRALQEGKPGKAAALDCGANVVGGVASTLAGYWTPGAYPVAAYRGWIGGIVSVDSKGKSRLATRSEATYYLVTMALQLLPYSLAGGAGVSLGLSRARAARDRSRQTVLGIPKDAWVDAARIYVLVVPLFAIASTFEFLMR